MEFVGALEDVVEMYRSGVVCEDEGELGQIFLSQLRRELAIRLKEKDFCRRTHIFSFAVFMRPRWQRGWDKYGHRAE